MLKASWFSLVLAGIGIVANIPALLCSLSLLRNWIALQTSHDPYFHYGYFSVAVPWLAASTLGISIAAIGIVRRRSNIFLQVFSLAIGLVGVFLLPNIGPRYDLQEAATKILGHADQSLSDWDDTHGTFPSDERELRDALATHPLHEGAIFYEDGKPLTYDVRLIANADAPALEPIPSKPGTLVYAVSSDSKEFWLTISTLQTPVGGAVVILRRAQRGSAFVANRKHHNPGERYQSFFE
jgi:hypothetical protein